MPGKLFLLPCSLGQDPISYLHLPLILRQTLEKVDIFIVENIRSTRRFFVQIGFKEFDHLEFIEMNKHQEYLVQQEVMQSVLQGKNAAIISESGLPCVADPGNLWVRSAHQLGIEVKPISGPSSIYLLLMSSGMNGQQFTFQGYLPKEANEKKLKWKEIISQVHKGYTQILIETPYRNNHFLQEALQQMDGHFLLAAGVNISSMEEKIMVNSIQEWKRINLILPKEPCIFALGK